MRSRTVFALATTIVLAASTTHPFAAETLNAKPGLWETTSVSVQTGTPPIPPDVMSRMTPQQRQMMEDSMQRAMANNGKPHTQQQCITQEEINSAFGNLDPRSGCQSSLVTGSAHVQETRITCNGATKASGTLHIEATTPENVAGSSQMTAGEGQQAMVMKTQFKSHWLGSDCGSVRPAGPGNGPW